MLTVDRHRGSVYHYQRCSCNVSQKTRTQICATYPYCINFSSLIIRVVFIAYRANNYLVNRTRRISYEMSARRGSWLDSKACRCNRKWYMYISELAFLTSSVYHPFWNDVRVGMYPWGAQEVRPEEFEYDHDHGVTLHSQKIPITKPVRPQIQITVSKSYGPYS